MNGKENIINKILSDADDKCAKILAAAEQTAQTIADNAQAEVARDKQAQEIRVQTLTAERIRNRVATAELDARKYKLNAKQQLIGKCYDRAYEHFVNLKPADKQSFVASLLKKYAENGEVVYVAKADKEVITQKFLDGIGKKLTLGKTCHNADGGVILEGAGYEKDLTLRRVVAYLREQTESKVAETLFGD